MCSNVQLVDYCIAQKLFNKPFPSPTQTLAQLRIFLLDPINSKGVLGNFELNTPPRIC
jgi:hypothetical protein